jgi:hypothetical protein
LFEEQLDHLERYGAVILAGQECISNQQAETLLRYARQGGTLVIAGNTGHYNEWRERRRVNPLLPARQEGRGRIVFIPDIVRQDARTRTEGGDQDPEPGATVRRGERMSPAQWVLPKNHQQIYTAIVDALPKGLAFTGEAPLTTVMELVNRPKSAETLLHVVNFDRRTKLTPFQVSTRKQRSGTVKSVTCLTPEHDDPVTVPFQEIGGRVTFTVPATNVYSLLVIAHE